MKNNHYKTILIIACAITILSSCADIDPWEDAHIDQFEFSNINNLHDQTVNTVSENELDFDRLDIYVDLSDGIAPAWQKQKNKEIFKWFLNASRLYGEVHTMGRASLNSSKEDFNIAELDDQGQLIETLMNPESASKLIYAQLQDNLNAAVDGNREALFISDFEEYKESGTKKVAESAIYSVAFQKWGDKGHNLYLYRLPYQDGSKEKNLVIAMLLSSENLESNGNSLRKSLGKELSVVPDLSFEHKPYSIFVQDSINSKLVGTQMPAYEVSADNDWKDWNPSLNHENVIFTEPWSFYLDPSFQEQVKSKLTEGLIINSTLGSYMKIKSFKIRTNDISEDLALNSEVNYFSEMQKNIQLSKDEGGNILWSVDDLNLPLLTEGFEENTKKLKSKYASPNFNRSIEVVQVIDLNETLIADLMKNDPTKVKLHTITVNDRIAQYTTSEPTCWRVTISVDDVELDMSQMDEYKFTDPTGNMNSSLSESLKVVARHWKNEILTKESTLYTFHYTFNL